LPFPKSTLKRRHLGIYPFQKVICSSGATSTFTRSKKNNSLKRCHLDIYPFQKQFGRGGASLIFDGSENRT
jgi:hypothetical protein